MGNIKIFQLLPDVYDMLLGVTNSIVIVISTKCTDWRKIKWLLKLNDQGISACMIQDPFVLHYTMVMAAISNYCWIDLITQCISCLICTQKCVSMIRKYKLFSTVYRKPLNISPPPRI
jgi:Fe-S oxidoreductase